MSTFKILTDAMIVRIIDALAPRFLGRDQDHLLAFGDEVADAAYNRAYDAIEPLQDFDAALQSNGGASLILTTTGETVEERLASGGVDLTNYYTKLESDGRYRQVSQAVAAADVTETATRRFFTDTERTKLGTIATGATANSSDAVLLSRANHTGTQAATTITQDASNRFVTDAEKAAWNGKQAALGYTPVNRAGDLAIAGAMRTTGEWQTTSANAFRMVQGNYGAFWRNDGSSLYLLMTASGDQYGNWNSLRPFAVNLSSGLVTLANGATISGNALFNGSVDIACNAGVKIRSPGLGSGLDIGGSPSLAGGTDPDVYLYQRNNGAIWIGTNNALRGKIQANGNIDWEHRIYAKGVDGGVNFVPSDGNVVRSAFLASGSYGGGYVMIDGSVYTGAWTQSNAPYAGYYIGVGTAAGLTTAARFTSSNQEAVVVNGRVWFVHNGVSAGGWYSDSTQNKKWFAGLYSDNDWGVYNSVAGWAFTVTQYGRVAIKDANSATLRTQPRIFVQSTDPGAAAEEGDLWIW